MTTVTTPLADLAERICVLNDRERLLLIDWIADGFDDPEISDDLFDGLTPCFAKAEEVLPDRPALDFPAGATRLNRWGEYRTTRDERLNLRLGQGK